MNEVTVPGAGSLAGSLCCLNQKSPLKNFSHQNSSQWGVSREEVSAQVAWYSVL